MKIAKFFGFGILALSLSFFLSSGVFADGGNTTLIHGCVAKDGTTRIVSPTTACKNSESARHWPTDARIVADEARITATETQNGTQQTDIDAIKTKNTQQDASIAALQGQGGGIPRVIDQSGNVIGILSEINTGNQSSYVRRAFAGLELYIFVSVNGIIDQGNSLSLLYISADCSGPPLVSYSTAVGPFNRLVTVKNGVGYFAGNNPTPGEITLNSYENAGLCYTETFFARVAPVMSINLTGFIAPFHVE